MNTADMQDVRDWASELRGRYEALKHAESSLRARDAAARLDVSEAELLACRCGDGVERLDGDVETLLKRLERLGPVMALTRNEHAVHEKTGVYRNLRFGGPHALVLDRQIDLRLRLDHWAFGFAVEEAAVAGTRRSLQFFDSAGTSVHKIHLIPDSDDGAFAELVARHRGTEQMPWIRVQPSSRQSPGRGIEDVHAFRETWRGMQDTHDFLALMRRHGVSRHRALQAAPDGFAREVTTDAPRRVLEAAAASGTSIMVFVGNRGATQIHTGPVHRLRTVGGWFNVLDSGFNLHFAEAGVASAYVVRKPTRDGIITSLEVFDGTGETVALFFGERERGAPEAVAWRDLVGMLPAAAEESA